MQPNLLRAKIVENQLSQKEVAKALGLSENTMTKRLSGKTAFNTDEVIKLCDLLNIVDDVEKSRIFLS